MFDGDLNRLFGVLEGSIVGFALVVLAHHIVQRRVYKTIKLLEVERQEVQLMFYRTVIRYSLVHRL